MHSQLTHIVTQQRIADLSRAAAERRAPEPTHSARRRAHPRPISRVAAVFARISAARA